MINILGFIFYLFKSVIIKFYTTAVLQLMKNIA